MPAAQTRARLGHLTIKTPGRASIDDLRRSFMADQQHIGQTLDRLRIETSVKITFRQFREALLQRQLIATPAFEAAGNNRHFFNAEGAQHPPGARRGEEIAFIVYHQMLIAADAKFAHGDGKRLRARHHVRQRAGVVREGFDIEKDVLGVVDGKEVRLKDLWPSDEEIDAVVKASVKPEQFRSVYNPMFAVRVENGPRVEPLYDWRPQSTYIRRPPYWEGALAGERTLTGLRPLAVLPDNITTDHLSPSNAIMLNSAAGEYLAKMGLPEEDFNSYATHRGDHLTAQRATFANPKLFNEMVRNPDGSVKQGSLARVEPEGKVMRMWEAIETYMQRKQPLIIIAGADYGQGSSRDWAAKGVRLAGVEAIAAEGFERIHRTNLLGMGVLPLEFKPGTTRLTLGIDGTETFDVVGELKPGVDLVLVIHRKDGERVEVPVTCRLDSDEEVSIYEAGGVLQRFAQDFLESSKTV